MLSNELNILIVDNVAYNMLSKNMHKRSKRYLTEYMQRKIWWIV